MSHWPAYIPDTRNPWNLARVVHLHRRAGFAATWNEIQRDLAEGSDATVARLLNGTSRMNGVPANFESLAATIGRSAVDAGDAGRTKAWWIYRCLFTPDPLTERLTLMWHNHFATSLVKVKNVTWMHRQNETFRAHARGDFRLMINALLSDPALLFWLDATENRKGHPNENLARELMELFTLGVGHYSEHDVREAARALTGLRIDENAVQMTSELHDDGEKSILGTVKVFDPQTLAELLVSQEATAERLAWRLCREFCGENVVDADAIKELANGLRERNLRIEWGVETILRSARFFSDRNLRNRVSDPMLFLLGAVRSLECFRDPPSTLTLADAMRRMGQDLFTPPNVGGWPGGRTWLSTQTVIARSNTIADLVDGRFHLPSRPWDPQPLLQQYGRNDNLLQTASFLGDLLFGGVEGAAIESAVSEAQRETSRDAQVRRLVVILLTRPQAHLN